MIKQMEKSQDQVSEYTKKALEAENQVEALLQKKQDEIDREMAAGGGNSGGSTTGFGWPLKGGAGRISSGFGGRKSPTAGASTYHKGVDLAAPSGTPILAAGSGKVVTATYSSSAGNYIMISHGNRLYTVYMHCSRLAVSAGKQVTKRTSNRVCWLDRYIDRSTFPFWCYEKWKLCEPVKLYFEIMEDSER